MLREFVPVGEGDGQFPLGHILVSFGQKAEELCLEVGFEQAVVLSLVQNKKIILSRTVDTSTYTVLNEPYPRLLALNPSTKVSQCLAFVTSGYLKPTLFPLNPWLLALFKPITHY